MLGEVFLQVAKGVGKVKGDDEAVRRWVFSVAHNRAMDAFRRDRRRQRAEAPGDAPQATTEDRFETIDPALVTALDTLTPDQREVIVLRFVADLPLEAVSAIVGKNLGSVKALQHRALKNLSEAVSPEA